MVVVRGSESARLAVRGMVSDAKTREPAVLRDIGVPPIVARRDRLGSKWCLLSGGDERVGKAGCERYDLRAGGVKGSSRNTDDRGRIT